jgi:hypothetical protein
MLTAQFLYVRPRSIEVDERYAQPRCLLGDGPQQHFHDRKDDKPPRPDDLRLGETLPYLSDLALRVVARAHLSNGVLVKSRSHPERLFEKHLIVVVERPEKESYS